MKEIEERIVGLEKQRKEELDSRRWMASCPERPNSFGRYEFFEKKVNEKFDKMILALRKGDKSTKRSLVGTLLITKVNNKQRKIDDDSHLRKDDDGESIGSSTLDSSIESSGDENESCDSDETGAQSSFDSSSDESSEWQDSDTPSTATDDHSRDDDSEDEFDDEYDPRSGSSKKDGRSNDADVVEIVDSDSDSSSASSRSVMIVQDRQADDESNEESENPDDGNDEAGEYDASASNDDYFEHDFNYSDDEDDADGEIGRYHASSVRRSKLAMAAQGFRCQANCDSTANAIGESIGSIDPRTKDCAPFDPSSIDYRGKKFHRNHCYVTTTKDGEVTVGIRRFLDPETAECVMVGRFESTILGTEDEGLEYVADRDLMGTHVQIHQCIDNLSLSKLERESKDVLRIPRLLYQPQTPGDWHTFGYFFDRTRMQKKGRRQGMRALELFAGAGGSLLGYKSCGFDTAMAVENDDDAIRTLRENNRGLKVYEGCIRNFIRDYNASLKWALGRIDHLHFSSPCQDFSSANRSQATGKRDRADLSLLLVDLVRMTSCATAVFENVVGIWQRKNVHYLKNIAIQLLRAGYQVRCTVLHSCDYGDPQRRPRVFMFIAKNSVPVPSFPAKTHGPGPDLWPYVTPRDALSGVTGNASLSNAEGRVTQLKPGQHGIIRLNPHVVSPTIRASSSATPFHFAEDRCINVREAASLQSFPPWYSFYGSVTSQYRQVGNAVPVELATAVAQSISRVLMYEYEEVEEE